MGQRQAERAPSQQRRARNAVSLCLAAVPVVLGLGACGGPSPSKRALATTTTNGRVPVSTHAVASSTTSTLAPGLVRNRVTAIGDSVMLDYKANLEKDLPGVVVDAAVSRQWSAGIAEVRKLRARDELGSTVVIALGTNGPISPSEFASMMSALSGTVRIVFVTVHVDKPWQQSVNATLRTASSDKDVVIADWAKLSSKHENWFYSDGTHLPIGGPGAQALAALVAKAVRQPVS